MIAKTKMSNRIISVIVTIALVFSMIPLTLFSVTAAETAEAQIVSDPSTIDDWKQYFPIDGDITTQNAGGVWTDKSVFTSATEIDGKSFSINGDNNFLVALSAIGSNMSITGQAAAPTDTVLVLDMSSSMSGNVGSLATATNAAIKALYSANPDNRVAIVTYSADAENATKIFLPLDSYTATGDFLTSRSDTLSIASGVKNSAGNTVSGSVSLNRGTYIQGGLARALEVLNARTTVTDRIPVVVLMTDGEPTIGSTNIAKPDGNLGFGVGGVYGGDVYNFATQLSLSYLKQSYSDMLLYTIGVGVDNSNSCLDILNPTEPLRSRNLRTYWDTYKNATVGSTVTVSNRQFTKPAELNYNYVSQIDSQNTKVNGYFSVSNNLATELTKAFEAVVAEIVKSSVYSPTLIQSAGHELSGYVSFVDKIGSYMKVNELKGIMYGGQLFTGEKIAEAFNSAYEGSTAGDFGNMSDPSSLGYAFMRSVETRLGIDNAKAWEVMRNAWQKGQISYNSSTGQYSNWFGWVSSSAGTYIEPWYEGMTLPTNAGYINRSFIYLGASDDTNMMYSTVRIREKVVGGIVTGEQEINFAVPASLLPTVTYEVTLDESNELEGIDVIADTPINLIYEVGLDPEINRFNIKDKVSAEYIAANTTENGDVLFYTNEWERTPDEDGEITGFHKNNTYAYFRPSQRNDRYYYQNDSLVYEADKTPYTSATVHPADTDGEYYYYYTYYAREGSSYKIIGEYHIIPNDVLSVASNNGNSTWSIKKGTVRSDYSGNTANIIFKDDPSTASANDGNKTGTLPFSHEPFADTNSHAWNDTTHSSVVGATLANNGRLRITPETGIRLTKSMASDVTQSSDTEPEFNFDIEYAGLNGNLDAYAYRFVNGELSGNMEAVSFVDGKASVTLKAGEVLYIGGMTAGSVTVTEEASLVYTIQTVSVNGIPQNSDTATADLAPGDMVDIDFINTLRGTGTFTVAKDITHDFGVGYVIPQNEYTTFKVELTFTFDGQPLAGKYQVAHTDGNESEITLSGAQNEKIEIALHHNDQYTVYGLPNGTKVHAVEVLTDAQKAAFTPSYYEDINEVTITENELSSVIIINDYTARSVSPDIEVSGTKTLIGNIYSDNFTFTLQKYDGAGAYTSDSSWTTLDTKTVSYSGAIGDRDFAFTYDWANEVYTTVGTYIYRVHESRPSVEGMIYDSRIHTFQINVTDNNMDGKLEANVTTSRAPQVTVASEESGNKWSVHTAFQNEYTSNHTVTTEIDVQKVIDNSSSESPLGTDLAGFKFGLYNSDRNLIEELTTNSIGAVRFSKTYTADEAGTYIYYLKEIAPNPVPNGWTYDNSEVKLTVTVSQIPDSNHYQAIITTDAGNATVNSQGNEVAVTFTNTYNPDDASLDVDFVSKQLASNAGVRELNSGEFEFAIYEVIDGVRGSSPVATGTNNSTGQVEFTKALSYSKVGGPYFYDIVEIKPQDAPSYITYDSTIYKLTVTVTDDNGRLKATPVVENAANNSVIFTNLYIAQPTSLTISGTKSITGRSLTENDFQFILTRTDTGEALYATNSTSDRAESTFTFPEITYTEIGTYTYTVTEYNPHNEIDDFADGVTYDDTVYNVVVTVSDGQNGQLTADYTVNGGDTPITFENAYAPSPIDVPITGHKVLFGRNILETDEFTFELWDAAFDPDTSLWTKDTKITDTTCLTDGAISFNIEDISKAGIYRYIISEKVGSANGVDYDAALWYVLVEITDDGNGNLTPAVYYMNEDGIQDRMVFINTYTPSDGYITVNGNKELTGRDLRDSEFTFNLYKTEDDSFNVTDSPIKTVKNDATGNFSFKLDFTKDDIGNSFYYVVKEENAGLTLNGVTYSSAEYHITVTVADDNNGNLIISHEITENGEPVEAMEFVNHYEATVSVAVEIVKSVENRGTEQIGPEGFEFLLENTGTNESIKLISNANGYADTALSYTQADIGKTYTYRLSEVVGSTANMTYDATVYTVTVSVETDENGELIANVTLDDSAVETVRAQFVNVYDYTPPTPPTPPTDVPDTPQTGDSSNVNLWIALLILSAAGILCTVMYGRKTKEEA